MRLNNKRMHQKLFSILRKFLKRKSLLIRPWHFKSLNLSQNKSPKTTKLQVRKLVIQSSKVIRTSIIMPEYWLKDLIILSKIKMLQLMMINSHYFSKSCHFICTKILNGKICIKFSPNLKSSKKKEKLNKIKEESKKKSKKDWRKSKVKAVNQNLSQSPNKRRKTFSVVLVQLIASKSKKKERTKLLLKSLKSKRRKQNQRMMMISCEYILSFKFFINKKELIWNIKRWWELNLDFYPFH